MSARKTRRMRDHAHPACRNGSLSLLVLVCLMVCMGLLTGRVRMVLLQQRHFSKVHAERQCEWLLRAGVQRAMRMVQETDGEIDEYWYPAKEIGAPNARVHILTSQESGAPLKVSVSAQWPLSNLHEAEGTIQHPSDDVIRRSHEFSVSNDYGSDEQPGQRLQNERDPGSAESSSQKEKENDVNQN